MIVGFCHWASLSPSILPTRTTAAIHRHPLFTSSSAFVAAAAATTALLNDLSYETLWCLASTQLCPSLSIVVDSPLSRPAHLDRLCHIADAEGARLLVIGCRPMDEEEKSGAGGSSCG
ncbi:hypothetical protein Nepgr_019249 [Nepenthes gracilis]|uniref:Uncharacterized protein n=1 Tax=Nepenthes gracilis TaxID=150966 RepID=A0AAD3STP8_NEPGR|nr:hypothetical protein Nepgr_019249 [Nepenthes gracilis]